MAVTSKRRHPDFPNIPTTGELGYPDANFQVWFGLFAPNGVPKLVPNVLIPVVEQVFKNPEVVNRATKIGLTVEYMGPEELGKFLESEIRIAKQVAIDANLITK